MNSSIQITGTYAGTVAIAEPAQLGVLDLAFDLTDSGGSLTGKIDPDQTLVFSGAPDLSGAIIGTTNGITPTFVINSAKFTSIVSGRLVERQVTLTGEVLDDGNALQGNYKEVLTGFTPEPLVTTGIFLVVRADSSAFDGGSPGPGPNPPAGGSNVYLPIVIKAEGAPLSTLDEKTQQNTYLPVILEGAE